jgi:hypothetical protein
MQDPNESQEGRENFEENVKEQVPDTPLQEVVRPIKRKYERPISKNALANKAAQDRNATNKRRAKNKMAKKSRRKNRKK